jgi:hypothetical protein
MVLFLSSPRHLFLPPLNRGVAVPIVVYRTAHPSIGSTTLLSVALCKSGSNLWASLFRSDKGSCTPFSMQQGARKSLRKLKIRPPCVFGCTLCAYAHRIQMLWPNICWNAVSFLLSLRENAVSFLFSLRDFIQKCNNSFQTS